MGHCYAITREIAIDAGHRVTNHGSKCKNLHGHRYVIQATCIGPLEEDGMSEGMVLDFGFLKEEMLAVIDAVCDHALILWQDDELLKILNNDNEFYRTSSEAIQSSGIGGKLYIVPFVPTAENLARHWFELLFPKVRHRTHGKASLTRIRVYETPNCWADYPIGVD